jgi:ADP-ribose pyrophosphatase YjhB (NUDIX family)
MDYHNIRYQYCPVCSGSLNLLKVKENDPPRLVCSQCNFIFFLDPKVVACTITEKDEKIVLVKRNIDPGKGKWVIPGGYVDRWEAVMAAAVRETKEECGLDIRIKHLLDVYSYPDHLPVIIVYVARFISGKLKAGDETSAAELFSENEIPWKDLAFKSTADALITYYKMHSQS